MAQKIFPEAYEQGKAEGLLAGRSEGRLEGCNDLLLRQLRKRFGQDIRDIRVQKRLRQATPEELEIWAERILDAKTLQDVFGDSLSDCGERLKD